MAMGRVVDGWGRRLIKARSLSSAVVSEEWQKLVGPSLSGVNQEVMQTLQEMRSLSMPGSAKPNILLWDQAFDVVENIASSPKKHLFRPQLALLGFAGVHNSASHLGWYPDAVSILIPRAKCHVDALRF